METIKKSVKNMNWKLFIALLVTGFVPTIYTTVRTFFLGQLPGEWAFSIAGQLSWINLIYEVVNEAIILPLFFFMGADAGEDKSEFSNRLKTGLLATAGIYAVLTLLIQIFAEPLLTFMAASPEIIEESAQYIRIESIANVFKVLLDFALVSLITLKKEKHIYILTGSRLILCLVCDSFLVSSASFSAPPLGQEFCPIHSNI
jgi:Na+-driven multidrug efflux pump